MIELPSKGFEALEEIKEDVDLFDEGHPWDEVFSKQFSDDIDAIEKELRALEIIKKVFKFTNEDFYYNEINDDYVVGGYRVNKEEYNLLKEALL